MDAIWTCHGNKRHLSARSSTSLIMYMSDLTKALVSIIVVLLRTAATAAVKVSPKITRSIEGY